MRIDETNLLHEKAKIRKDGVYSFRGNMWVVKDKKFVALQITLEIAIKDLVFLTHGLGK